MARVRFEDVTIKAGAIELDGIEDPSSFMRGLGLQDAKVKEEQPTWEDAEPPVGVPEETPSAAQIEEEKEEVVEERPRVEIQPEHFSGARRLRDVVQVFMDAGIQDVDEIVRVCVSLKELVPILGRMSDIPGRMPVAVNMWLEQNA